ncbi:MAG: hypothetical protein IKM43_01500 [Clostridia bacterium]|nr:hypothetical protein [Clostridia bacterium]
MREIALATGVRNKNIIEYLYTLVQSKIDFCKKIVTSYADKNFCYLLLACDDAYIEPCEKILREIIIDYIESVYKVEYLKNKIKNKLCDTLAFKAYIKVLALFDKSTDVNALEKIMLFNQTFFVDSFLEFRLNPLKKHWDNLAELSSDNLAMFNSGTFLDVIRFLINTMDSVVYKVKVICNGKNYSVYNMKSRNAEIKKTAECNDALELITNVLNSCPNYIDIYVGENNDEAVSFLSNVYTNRLKIHSKS